MSTLAIGDFVASGMDLLSAATTEVENNPVLNITIFAAFVAVTMFIVLRASRNNKSASDYYAGGRSFTGPQNGFAISGDYLSAASFLGICGAIAVNGYDGFLYSIGFLVAWLVALLIVAELMRNTGKFTMADVLSFRLKQRPGLVRRFLYSWPWLGPSLDSRRMCSPSGSSSAPCAWPRPSRLSPYASSTCSRRWPEPAAWCRCSWASTARSASRWSSPSSAP
jgi:hypothetical protein